MTENQAIMEFAPDRSTAGFRLHHFSVFNWGTFHERVHTLTPDGRTSLLSGANGSGKSTLADAILTLLIDSRKRNYNQASGQMDRRRRKERSEKDYILGAYAQKHDEDYGHTRTQTLRKPGETHSVLLAVFYNETFNTYVSLAQVLWINSGGRIERVYLAERRALSIAGDFDGLGSPAELRARLRERGIDPIESFTAYSQCFHEYLFLPRGKSPMDIFNQAICIKDIANLTQFIRDHMLDDGGAAEKLANLRKNFEELRLTYKRILTDKERLEALDTIHHQHEAITKLDGVVQRWNERLSALPLFFADKEYTLRTEEADRLAIEHAKASADILAAEQEAERQRQRAKELDAQLSESDEGRQLRKLEEELKGLEPQLKERKERHQRFTKQAQVWREGSQADSTGAFAELQSTCQRELPKLEETARQEQEALNELKTEQQQNIKQQKQLEADYRSLLDSRGNISREFVERRVRIANAIGVAPEQLPYAGELLQVRETETAWTGALERLARSFALSILVPEDLRRKVDDYVHREHQHGLVVYHIVNPQEKGSPNPLLQNDWAARKLEVHPEAGLFGAWLERELTYRFPHRCFESPDDAFHRAEYALTINGLIRQRIGERRKDDRSDINNRLNYVLGWDNQAKLRAHEAEIKTLQASEREREIIIKRQNETCKNLTKRIEAAKGLFNIASAWAEIDFEIIATRIATVTEDIAALRRGSERLKQLREQLKEAEGLEKTARDRIQSISEQRGEIVNQQKINQGYFDQAISIQKAAESATTETFDPRIHHSALEERLAFPVTKLSILGKARGNLESDVKKELNSVLHQREHHESVIKHDMQQFLARLQTEDARLHDELVSEYLALPGYNAQLYEPFGRLRARIQDDDLPKTEERFKALLHNNVIEEVANFDGLLDNHARAITRRIDELNEHLRQIDFDRREGSYIQLVATRNQDEHQKKFRAMRQYVMGDITEATRDAEARRETYLRIEGFLTELEKDETWTQRVIDVRNWFEFRADEFFRANEILRQSYEGASAKSGGEKNRLASTILATAIAYQYGISVNERQSDTFRLVVVDEMFSKTDDEFSTYLLELFREFHLQLIIIQPLDSKIHLVQKYVERYHIVTRSGDVSTVRNLTVQEYEEALADQTVS